MALHKDVVDCKAADDVSVLRASVDVVLIGEAMQMFKQGSVVLRQDRLRSECFVSGFIVVENAHWIKTPNAGVTGA